MNLTIVPGEYAVCRLGPDASLPELDHDAFFSVTRTADEMSIVCDVRSVPDGVECEAEWRILKIEGPLDFDLVGVLAAIASPLADAKVSVFAISTFETDYVLVRTCDLGRAVETLRSTGQTVFTD